MQSFISLTLKVSLVLSLSLYRNLNCIADRFRHTLGRNGKGTDNVNGNGNENGLTQNKDYTESSGLNCRCGEELIDDNVDYILGGQAVKIVSFSNFLCIGGI